MNILFQSNFKVESFFQIFEILFYFNFFSQGLCKPLDQKNIQAAKILKNNLRIFSFREIFYLLECKNNIQKNNECFANLIKDSGYSLYFVNVADKKTSIYCLHCFDELSIEQKDSKNILCSLKYNPEIQKCLFTKYGDEDDILCSLKQVMIKNFTETMFLGDNTDSSWETKHSKFRCLCLMIQNILIEQSFGDERRKNVKLYEDFKSKCIELQNKKQNIIPKYVIDSFKIVPIKIMSSKCDNSFFSASLQMFSRAYAKSKEDGLNINQILNGSDLLLDQFFYTLERMKLGWYKVTIYKLIECFEKYHEKSQSLVIKTPQIFFDIIFQKINTLKNSKLSKLFEKFILFKGNSNVFLPRLALDSSHDYVLECFEECEMINMKNCEFIIAMNCILVSPQNKISLREYFDKKYKFKQIDDEFRCISAIYFNHEHQKYIYINKQNSICDEKVDFHGSSNDIIFSNLDVLQVDTILMFEKVNESEEK